MSTATQKIQQKILKTALKDIPFDGLSWDVIVKAAEKSGYDADVAGSVFTDGLTSFLRYFAQWADEEMLKALPDAPADDIRIRERVELAVWTRLEILGKHKEAVRLSAKHWVYPMRKPVAGKIVWATADCIWQWAGDTSMDYNKYTKRGLLAGVITATTLYWINDKSDENIKTRVFLQNRIDNILKIGQLTGKLTSKLFGKKTA